MATLIVVTSPDDVEGFVALARRFAGASVFPTLAVYKGVTHVSSGEFDAIEGVSWLEQLDLEHCFDESLERLAIDRLVLQMHDHAYAADQCSLLLHRVRTCQQIETILLDRGHVAGVLIPERAIVPADSGDIDLAVRMSPPVVMDHGWTVVVAAHGASPSERDRASLKMVELLKRGKRRTHQRISSALVPTPGQSDAVREMLTEHDILMLGQGSFEDLRTYRMGDPATGDLPVPRGTIIAAIRAPIHSRGTGFLNQWRNAGLARIRGLVSRPESATSQRSSQKSRRAELLLALTGTAVLAVLGLVLKMNVLSIVALISLLGSALIPTGSPSASPGAVGHRAPLGKH